MTDEEKREAYREYRYHVSLAVPVCSIRWDEAAWIKYIDANGKWLPRKEFK